MSIIGCGVTLRGSTERRSPPLAFVGTLTSMRPDRLYRSYAKKRSLSLSLKVPYYSINSTLNIIVILLVATTLTELTLSLKSKISLLILYFYKSVTCIYLFSSTKVLRSLPQTKTFV